MSCIQGSTRDLPTEGARSTNHQNLHGTPCFTVGSLVGLRLQLLNQSPSSFNSSAPPSRPMGIRTQKMAAVPKISEAMDEAQLSLPI
jgi:hypothetical protein